MNAHTTPYTPLQAQDYSTRDEEDFNQSAKAPLIAGEARHVLRSLEVSSGWMRWISIVLSLLAVASAGILFIVSRRLQPGRPDPHGLRHPDVFPNYDQVLAIAGKKHGEHPLLYMCRSFSANSM